MATRNFGQLLALSRKALATLLYVAACVAGGMLSVPAHAAEQRIALVIGNGSYAVGGTLGTLLNPVNDARLLRDTLEKVGFQVVYRENANQNEMERAISMFTARLEKAGSAGVALFYYAGHGMQSGGENFLLPVDARPEREADLRFNAVRAGDVLAQMDSTGASVKIVILDACRENPFASSFGSDLPKGLADISLDNTEFFVAYAATAGNLALDGSGSNSPYALALARRLATPDSELSNTFMLVRTDVSKDTDNEQLPEVRSTMKREFAFVGRVAQRNDRPAFVAELSTIARPRANMLFGKWCEATRGNGTTFAMEEKQLTYFLGKQGSSFRVQGIIPSSEGRLQVIWENNGTPTYLEFGEFDPEGRAMTQVRGRQGATGPWKDHFKRFRRCS